MKEARRGRGKEILKAGKVVRFSGVHCIALPCRFEIFENNKAGREKQDEKGRA